MFAVFIGLLVAGVPTNLGLYRWLAHVGPGTRGFMGLSPAFMLPEEYDKVRWEKMVRDKAAADGVARA